MDVTPLPPDAPLPDDVPALQALARRLLAELARLRAENAELRDRLDAALKHRFGKRSERRRRKRPPGGGDERPPPARDAHGRAALPEHLERREVVHDLTEAEKLCPCCGQERVCIGEQVAEQLDWEPARFFVLRTCKKTYACRHCDPTAVPAGQRLQTAGPEQVGPLAKGLCGPGLLAHVICAKFADHLPLHRQVGQLARGGVELARSTLGDWMAQAAQLAGPLVGLMHRRALQSRLLHGDDTPVKLRVAGADGTRKSHLWVYIGDADHPYVVFDFTAGYTGAGPQAFLEGYRGYLEADALAQYEALYGEGGVRHCCCWAHARRKFVAAAEGRGPGGGGPGADRPALRHRAAVAAVAAAVGDGRAAVRAGSGAAGPAAAARAAGAGRAETVAGATAAAGAAEVGVGPGHRLRLEQLGGPGAVCGAGLSADRQQPQRADLAGHRGGPEQLGGLRQ